METIAVTIVIMIMLVIGLVFWAGFGDEQAAQSQLRANQLDALTVATAATNLDELKCVRYTRPSPNCIDYDRAKVLADLIETDDNFSNYYFRFLSYATINLSVSNSEYIEIYHRPRNQTVTSRSTIIPVLVHQIDTDEYMFSELEVTTY